MNTLLISYDLKKPEKDYPKLWNYLESFDYWAKPLRSLYLVKSSFSAEGMRNALKDNYYVDNNDKIIVIDVTGDSAAWRNLDSDVSDWIAKYL